jgi:hypothetical protein
MLVACAGCSSNVDVKAQLKAAEVTTGWFDAGIVEGSKNKLVPTVQFQLQNVSTQPVASVQVNAVFRLVNEQEEWGSAFARGIGPDGLGPGSSTAPIVLRSQLGYTGEQPRAELLQHSQFKDAKVEIFAKYGSQQWVKIHETPVKRQLLTR